MGKHKHKKSKKSSRRREHEDSSDEWEEKTAPVEETSRSKAHLKMRKPLDDDDDDSQRCEPDARINVSAAKEEVLEESPSEKEKTDRDCAHGSRRSEEQTRDNPEEDKDRTRVVRSLPADDVRITMGKDVSKGGTQTPAALGKDDMNKLSAKILKAELRGDQETVQRLKAKLDVARHLAEQAAGDEETRVIVITKSESRHDQGKRISNSSCGREKKKMRNDDAWHRLEDKFVRKKVESDERMDAVLQRAINKMEAGSSRELTEGNGEHDDEDDEESGVRSQLPLNPAMRGIVSFSY
ncbi:CWF19-like protein 2 homolog [Galendromus occidentalis]|uniref:CWF19-like protein 2 homolog n=1 Tax=Galendromus occidentalis TaxID=34638 RepID=A0AAJ7L6I4_9ACAR|nr:CWF19-like protein 2 homolog [Galendromus occidentalis]